MKPIFLCLAVALSLASYCSAEDTYDNYVAEWKAKCDSMLALWREPEGKKDASLEGELVAAAVRSSQSNVVEEVAAGGDVASLEIKLPTEITPVVAKALSEIDDLPTERYGQRLDFVIRRMTKSRFELWTPKRGLLFGADGSVLNTALPPRRDGTGRSWHGAFLPDGRWITTDLWDMDRTLSFFSRDGKMLREIKVAKLSPVGPDEPWSVNLIGWARCAANGKGWVVSVGDGCGRARVFVEPQGGVRQLKDENAPWKLCYPRDLEPKGMYTALSCPSDDFKCQISFSAPGHGEWCGYPTYVWGEGNTEGKGKVLPTDGDSIFGFLPGSHNVFIGSSDYDNGDTTKPRHLKTWFFDASGKCQGWIRAAYLTGPTSENETWYLDEENCVVKMGADLLPRSRAKFEIHGETAKAAKLFTDLRIGFFFVGKKLMLASW